MNAIWIQNISSYRFRPEAIKSAEHIIDLKIKRREFLLKKYGQPSLVSYGGTQNNFTQILLYEARAARYYWKKFSLLLPAWCNFPGRKARQKDIVNTLLDLGYHNVTHALIHILNKYDIFPAPALLHVAHKSKSAPLAYDLVEMFRADIAETEVLKFLRQKKKPLEELRQKDIGRFLARINRRLERKYFIKQFGYCQTYRYYMELQVLAFVKAVNHKTIFKPLQLPMRHENRCAYCTAKPRENLTLAA